MSKTVVSELRIPADPSYIVVAKRAAAGFGCVAGFGVEAVDDLCIAVAQACENAIRCAESAGAGTGSLIRLAFTIEGERLEVQVRSTCQREDAAPVATAPAAAPAAADERVRAEARRLAAAARARAIQGEIARQHAQQELALRVMGLFVDDCVYRVDERTGGLRVRLTKYRVS